MRLRLDAFTSISSTYPGESVGWSVTNSFRCPLCRRLWTATKRLWTTGRDIFSESYDQQLSHFNFQSVFLHVLSFVSLFGIQLMDMFQFSVGPLDRGPLRCWQQCGRVAFEGPSANAVIRASPNKRPKADTFSSQTSGASV